LDDGRVKDADVAQRLADSAVCFQPTAPDVASRRSKPLHHTARPAAMAGRWRGRATGLRGTRPFIRRKPRVPPAGNFVETAAMFLSESVP
jgi:hypothetical protein